MRYKYAATIIYLIVAAILFRSIFIYQDNNLNVIKDDKDEQLVKQKVNPIISQIQRESDKEFKKFSEEFNESN